LARWHLALLLLLLGIGTVGSCRVYVLCGNLLVKVFSSMDLG